MYNQLETTENKELKFVKVNVMVPPESVSRTTWKMGNIWIFNFLMLVYGRLLIIHFKEGISDKYILNRT